MRTIFCDKFPTVDLDNIEEFNKFYNAKNITVFDHCLSEEEALNCDYLYHDLAKRNGATVSFLKCQKKFELFFYGLYCRDDTFIIIHKGIESHVNFKRYKKISNSIIKEKMGPDRRMLFFPNHSLVLDPGFDLTHHLYLLKGEDWNRIEALVMKCGLYFMP